MSTSTILIPVLVVVGVGLIMAIILTIASKVLAVPVDQMFIDIREVLPGANCGGCGYAGCDDYAAALAEDMGASVPLTACPVGGADLVNSLSGIMGIEAEAADPKVAVVRCNGSLEMTRAIMDYKGTPTCKSAKQFYGGQWACTQGCLGLGDCQVVCDYDAIIVKDGLARIDREACVGCGQCVKTCPNGVIELRKKSNLVFVQCNSQRPGAMTRKACSVGCIGCKKCEKACKFEAVKVENNMAVIDADKCKNCGLCAKECPTGAIANLRKKKK